MDLVLMAINNKEPMEIILLTYFEIDSTVNGISCVSKQLGTCHRGNFANVYRATERSR